MKTFGINVPDVEINDLFYTGTHVIHVTGTLSATIPIGSVLSSIPSGLKDFQSFVLSADYHALNRETYHGYMGTAAITTKSLRKMGVVGSYNFHQAFLPAGYYSPPFGETPTIETIDGAIIPKPTTGGPCPYNAKEDFELFGMITTQNKVNSFTINMGFMPIFEPSEECPPQIAVGPFYEPVSMNISAGTMKHIGLAGGIGGNFYNDNPIPASIDTKNILHSKASLWDLIRVPNDGGYLYYYRIDANKQAIPIVPSKPNHDKLNNILCKARSLETNTIPGIGFVVLQLGAADGFAAAMNDQYNFGGYDAWNMWHFYFRYNHWNYPFQGSHEDKPRLVRQGKFETQVAEEHWWEDRQCANTNDFLPWTTSTTIKACPSDYFDVPYYSAIRRFGFYGTRFQNTCKKIDFIQTGQNGEIFADYPNQSGQTVPTGTLFGEGDDDILDSLGPASSASALFTSEYDNLLSIANQEEKFADFYAANKAFFLWGNYSGAIANKQLKPLVDNREFSALFSGLKTDFDRVFQNIHNFISGGYNAFVMLRRSPAPTATRSPIIGAKFSSENDFALTSDYWNQFDRKSREILTGKSELLAYDYALKTFTHFIYDFQKGGVDHNWYDNFIKEKEKRIRTRYFENKVHGFPIDLFPTNEITLSSEEAWKNMGFDDERGTVTQQYFRRQDGGYAQAGRGQPAPVPPENTGWLRSSYGDFSTRDILPTTEKRYFYGAYVNSGEILTWSSQSNSVMVQRPNAQRPFYAGFLNDAKCGADLPNPTEERAEITGVVSGSETLPFDLVNSGMVLGLSIGRDVNGQFVLTGSGQVPTGGYAGMPKAGYSIPGFKEVGKLNSNFSCFSPIFTQDPINTICKIGQAPTFRVEAVDYHSIPEDKIKNARYSEINYWTSKLKLTDKNKRNLYPLKYKWYRISKQGQGVEEIQRTKAFDQAPIVTGYGLVTVEAEVLRVRHGVKEDIIDGLRRDSVSIEVSDPAAFMKNNPVRLGFKDYRNHAAGHEEVPPQFNEEYRILYTGPIAEEASITGNWGCLEGDNSKECTVCHPRESVFYNGTEFVTGITMNPLENNTFIKGAKNNNDENYLYFCVVSGRFGHRTSELASLSLETFAAFDMSMMIGMNTTVNGLAVVKEGYLPLITQGQITDEKHSVTFVAPTARHRESVPNYPYVPFAAAANAAPFFGFIKDMYVFNEQVIEENINMSNNCVSYAFVGPDQWRGYLRSYTPSTQAAVNGVVAKRSHWKDYGPLMTLSKTILTQRDGDLLYGVKTLPTCTNYQMHNLNKGVTSTTSLIVEMPPARFSLRGGTRPRAVKVRHKNVGQKAFVTNNSRVGLRSFQYEGIPQLYPPGTAGIRTGGGTNSVGIWQFHNNIGSIKRFGVGRQVPDVDITVDTSIPFSRGGADGLGAQNPVVIAQDTFKGLFSGSSLGGDCGFHPEAVGANLLYFVENFQRFYIACPAKGGSKGKIRNFSYTAPGLRFGTSIVQYNWLGKPSSTYLKRKTKAGPYAYEWKVIRHNRDRRGNGWSEGFWSSFWGKKMYLYDQPAVYGLYPTGADLDPSYKARAKEVLSLRGVAQGTIKPAGLIQNLVNFHILPPVIVRNLTFTRFGPARGPKYSCGAMRVPCSAVGAYDSSGAVNDNTNPICNWLDVAMHIGPTPRNNYGCTRAYLDQGICFDPCLSLKYTQGFYPGGKKLSLTAGFREPGAITTTQLVSEEGYKDLVLSQSTRNRQLVGSAYDVAMATSQMQAVTNPQGGKGVIRLNLRPGSNIFSDTVTRSIMRGPRKSVSPCKDGGADHCNYLTPVINIGETSVIVGGATPDASLRVMFGAQMILSFNENNEYVAPKNVT